MLLAQSFVVLAVVAQLAVATVENCRKERTSEYYRKYSCRSSCNCRGAFDLIPSQNTDILDLQDTITDLAQCNDQYAREVGIYQALVVTGILVGETCLTCDVFTKFITAYLEYQWTGNGSKLIPYLCSLIIKLKEFVTRIALVQKSKIWVDYSKDKSIVEDCRCLRLDNVWEGIIKPCDGSVTSILTTQKTLTERMYESWSDRSNVVAAGVTAAGALVSLRFCTSASGSIVDFLRTLSACGDSTATGSVALVALDAAYAAAVKQLS